MGGEYFGDGGNVKRETIKFLLKNDNTALSNKRSVGQSVFC